MCWVQQINMPSHIDYCCIDFGKYIWLEPILGKKLASWIAPRRLQRRRHHHPQSNYLAVAKGCCPTTTTRHLVRSFLPTPKPSSSPTVVGSVHPHPQYMFSTSWIGYLAAVCSSPRLCDCDEIRYELIIQRTLVSENITNNVRLCKEHAM
jgi:hypothetical protein